MTTSRNGQDLHTIRPTDMAQNKSTWRKFTKDVQQEFSIARYDGGSQPLGILVGRYLAKVKLKEKYFSKKCPWQDPNLSICESYVHTTTPRARDVTKLSTLVRGWILKKSLSIN